MTQKINAIHIISQKGRTVKKTYQLSGRHIFPNGTVLTNEEFMSKEIIVDPEENKEVFLNAARVLSNKDPEVAHRNYAKLMENKRKVDELLAERAKIEGLI